MVKNNDYDYFNNKSLYSIDNLKKIFFFVFQKNKVINLEMNYVYDHKFCLWAIKNGFGDYFY